MKQRYQPPILAQTTHDKLNDAVAAFTGRQKWKDWGLDKLREQGVAILLHGPPGTGKTITAYYLAKKLHLQTREISMADFGSQIPGQLARNIVKIFQTERTLARDEHRRDPVILLDECDAMLISRNKLGPNMVWMLEPINMLLSQISKYPGLVVLATNYASVLDDALERRLLARIAFSRPDYPERLLMWQAKWPRKFPFYPTVAGFEMLAQYDLTGAQIENAFLLWAGRQLRQGVEEPRIETLADFLKLDFVKYYA